MEPIIREYSGAIIFDFYSKKKTRWFNLVLEVFDAGTGYTCTFSLYKVNHLVLGEGKHCFRLDQRYKSILCNIATPKGIKFPDIITLKEYIEFACEKAREYLNYPDRVEYSMQEVTKIGGAEVVKEIKTPVIMKESVTAYFNSAIQVLWNKLDSYE